MSKNLDTLIDPKQFWGRKLPFNFVHREAVASTELLRKIWEHLAERGANMASGRGVSFKYQGWLK